MNNIDITIGYKYFIFSFDIIPNINDKINVLSIINTINPIVSAGPAVNGKR